MSLSPTHFEEEEGSITCSWSDSGQGNGEAVRACALLLHEAQTSRTRIALSPLL